MKKQIKNMIRHRLRRNKFNKYIRYHLLYNLKSSYQISIDKTRPYKLTLCKTMLFFNYLGNCRTNPFNKKTTLHSYIDHTTVIFGRRLISKYGAIWIYIEQHIIKYKYYHMAYFS